MNKKNNHIAIIAMAIVLLFIGSISTKKVFAEEINSATQFYSFSGDEGLVDGSREFIINANPGENFDIQISFTGISQKGDVVSFTYDKVTDDQMVANVNKSDDRSGLLNETVTLNEHQTRNFSAAALDGNIIITATGKCKIVSIKAVKQAEKTAGKKTTVYTIGDSLVQTYSERYAPQTGWGQLLSLYFDNNVSFVNRALGGRSTGNYIRQGRLNEVLCEIAPGDIVLIEFGHNDADSSKADRYVSPTNFTRNLTDVYIKAIRDRGAIPVLVTLCNRNQYIAATDEFRASYPEYVTAMKKAAETTDTLIIDLNAITIEYFGNLCRTLGSKITNEIIYNHAIAGAYTGDYSKGIADDTHLQYYGAKLVAGFISEELQKMNLSGVSEHYTPLVVTSVPSTPTNIRKKSYEGFLSRFKWDACENADYYKILVAEVVEVASYENPDAPSTYELAGDFEIAGYTTISDYGYKKAEEGKHYAYKIIAINAAGESAESEIFSFGLLPASGTSETPDSSDPTPTEPPQNTTLIIIAAISITILAAAIILILIRTKNKNK